MKTEPKSLKEESTSLPSTRRASIFQVFATMFCGIFAIGAKGTWQKDGATITITQVIIAAAITLIVLVLGLVAIVKLVTH
ncbi:MAG: DUF2970 domain-containing protein [Burkholderiales bacterium]|nr:DUF2970 domain-containing protein [Burkholderiales bacterium]